MEEEKKIKNIEELEGMQVAFLFPQKQVSVVDLTARQAAIIIQILGFEIDEESDIVCYDDNQLDDLYGRKAPANNNKISAY